jgi:hypothetical protein
MPDVWSMSAVLINAAALLLALGFRAIVPSFCWPS